MIKIAEQRPELKRVVRGIEGGGPMPEQVRAVVVQQFLDAIGTLHASTEQMQAQLRKTEANIWATHGMMALGLVEEQPKELAAS